MSCAWRVSQYLCTYKSIIGEEAGDLTATPRSDGSQRWKLTSHGFWLWLSPPPCTISFISECSRSFRFSIPGSFQALTGVRSEQSGLIWELALLWSGGRNRDLLRSLSMTVTLWLHSPGCSPHSVLLLPRSLGYCSPTCSNPRSGWGPLMSAYYPCTGRRGSMLMKSDA